MIKKLGLLSFALSGLLSVACGGGGGGGGVGGTFCNQQATAICKKLFMCPDPNFPIPAGATQAQCVADTTKLCTDKPPVDQVPDVNCYGATHVNTAAQTMCLSMIDATTCADFIGGTYTYNDVCSMVCTAAPSTGTAGAGGTGAAGASGTGTAGSSGTGTAGSSGAAAGVFCRKFSGVNCDQAFKCVAPADRDATFTAALGATIAECKGAMTDAQCATPATDCPNYSAVFGDACLSKFTAQTCDDLALNGLPAECGFVCQ